MLCPFSVHPLLPLQGDAISSSTAEKRVQTSAGSGAELRAVQAAPLAPCWDVAQAAVALRAPLSPAALGPFGLMLLSVAVLPLWHPHWWEDNANRLKVLQFELRPLERAECGRLAGGANAECSRLTHICPARPRPSCSNMFLATEVSTLALALASSGPPATPTLNSSRTLDFFLDLILSQNRSPQYLRKICTCHPHVGAWTCPLTSPSTYSPSTLLAFQVAAVLGGPVALWALLHAPPLLLHTLTEYCTFIALLGSMYAITGAMLALAAVPCLASTLTSRCSVCCGAGAHTPHVAWVNDSAIAEIRKTLQ